MPLFRRKGVYYKYPYGGGRAKGATSFLSGYRRSSTKGFKRRKTAVRSMFRKKAKTTGKSSRRRAVLSFRSKYSGLRRRVRRGASALGMLRMFTKRANGSSKTGPWDQYIYTGTTSAITIDPGSSSTVAHSLWGWGSQVGTMLSNIRLEAPSTLIGGAVLMQPKLYVYGFAQFDIVPAGNSPIAYELIVCTPSKGVTGM